MKIVDQILKESTCGIDSWRHTGSCRGMRWLSETQYVSDNFNFLPWQDDETYSLKANNRGHLCLLRKLSNLSYM